MKAVKGRTYSLRSRLLLALAVVPALFLLLELVFRLVWGAWAPTRLGPGYFRENLELVSGFSRGTHRPSEIGIQPLETEKQEGEIRIFVFGESSVEGVPWGTFGSFPWMLHELLAERYPDRLFTVVNMGKASAMSMDLHYYLMYAKRYQPDFIVFYSGMNDEFNQDPEMCRLVLHPHLYGVWSWMTEHSAFFWSLRAMGPGWLAGITGEPEPGMEMGEPRKDLCPRKEAFSRWTGTLVQQALEQGARVLIATPVLSPMYELEAKNLMEGGAPIAFLKTREQKYRQLLLCTSDLSCDYREEYRKVLDKEFGEQSTSRSIPDRFKSANTDEDPGTKYGENTEYKIDAWKRAAKEHGAVLIDFHEILSRSSPGGWIGPDAIVDEIHLTPRANLLLAELIARELADLLQLPAAAATPWSQLPEGAYLRPEHRTSVLEKAVRALDNRMFFLGLSMLRFNAEHFSCESSLQLLNWFHDLPAGKDTGDREWENLRDEIMTREFPHYRQ